jgi:hypothetical protein
MNKTPDELQRDDKLREKIEVIAELDALEAELRESKNNFHAYGIESDPDWYRDKKYRQNILRGRLSRIKFDLGDLQRRIVSENRTVVSDAFMQVASKRIDSALFAEILHEAESLAGGGK